MADQTALPRANAAGTIRFPGTDITINRMGYGAMQLAGPGVFGPPKDVEQAKAVLREAVALGVDHIDTSDFYGPHVTNQIIREALAPYPANLTLVSKIGSYRDDKANWILDRSSKCLTAGVEDNLKNLGIEQVPVVNLRMGGPEDDVIAPMETMAKLKEQGLIGHIGLSTVTQAQIVAARDIAPVVCIQNPYNIVMRDDDALIDWLAEEGIPYVPYFPLGGFTPIKSEALNAIATEAGATSQQVALAWLLQRSANIAVIPGTKSVEHLRQNIAAASLKLSPEIIAKLDALGNKA